MDANAAEVAATWMFAEWRKERDRLDEIDTWCRWGQPRPPAPRRSSRENKALLDLARTPWLGLVVTSTAQNLHVDGHRSPAQPVSADEPVDGPPTPWDIWLANDLDARQSPVHRATLGHGYSYAKVLPGTIAGRSMAVIRGISARNGWAAWADPAGDDWPIMFLEVTARGRDASGWDLSLYDEVDRHRLTTDAGGTKFTYIVAETHGAGFCPIARCANQLDLEGRTPGEVEPFIDVARRIDKTTFDRLMTQHFNSWKVRTIAGLAQSDPDPALGELTPDEQRLLAEKEKLRLSQEDLLVAEDTDTKFGVLDGTPLDGFIKAHESDIEALAATSQTPAHNLTGKMINLSAEALAAAESMLQRKVAERQRSFGKFWDQILRAAAGMSGNAEAAGDYRAHVTWSDTESRSLSQAADALGKLASQLQIPAEGLWDKIPGVTDTDIAGWKKLATETNSAATLAAQLDNMAGDAAQRGVTA